MNNDYMNDEMEIDLIELLKYLLRNIKNNISCNTGLWFNYFWSNAVYFT